MFSNTFVNIFVIGLAVAFVWWFGVLFGPLAAILVALAIALVGIIVAYFNHNRVSINEMEVGVVFNKKGDFVCFLDNDYGRITPGQPRPRKRNTPLTRHAIDPIHEEVTSIIGKGGQKAEGTLDKVRTIEGIPIKVKWAVSFKIIAVDIKKGVEFKMARGLPENAPNMIGGKASKALTHLIEMTHIHDLYRQEEDDEGRNERVDDDPRIGSLQQLELELLAKVRELTAVFGADIGDNDVKIGPIELPDGFEIALQNGFQKALQTDSLVAALAQLHDAVSQYDDDDIRRLTKLERLRILDEKGGPLMMVDSFVNSNKTKEVTYNGRSPQEAQNSDKQ